MALVSPEATLSNADFSALKMQSASPFAGETSRTPWSDAEEPVLHPLAVGDVEPDGRLGPAEQRLGAALREALEKLGRRVWHRAPFAPPSSSVTSC